MIAVLTGDIVNSKSVTTEKWIGTLKSTLSRYGETPKHWEIYRGDSFQMQLPVEQALFCSLHLKSCIKQIDNLDVRIGIGVGEKEYESTKVTESNGSAYIRSGECFDGLNKQNIVFNSGYQDLDLAINAMLGLSLYISDKWSVTVSKVVNLALENPDLKQTELAKKLNKSQSNISEALKRGGFYEIMRMNAYYEKQIMKLC